MVPRVGFEPTRPKTIDFESIVSAISPSGRELYCKEMEPVYSCTTSLRPQQILIVYDSVNNRSRSSIWWELVDINDRSHNRLNRSPPIRFYISSAPRFVCTDNRSRRGSTNNEAKTLAPTVFPAVTVSTLIEGGQYLVVNKTCLSHSCYAYMSRTTCKR